MEVPIGEFFRVCHGRIREYSSALTAVNPGMGASWGLNSYFPMPFLRRALVTLEHREDTALGGPVGALWYHVDYETYGSGGARGFGEVRDEGEILHFHAQFRMEPDTVPAMEPANHQLHQGVNLDGGENYVALSASGRGHMVGLVLSVDNKAGGWWGARATTWSSSTTTRGHRASTGRERKRCSAAAHARCGSTPDHITASI